MAYIYNLMKFFDNSIHNKQKRVETEEEISGKFLDINFIDQGYKIS